MSSSASARSPSADRLPRELVERVLSRLGLAEDPTLDLDDLNRFFAAYCGAISFDNVRKRIWCAGDRSEQMPGADAEDFFENWLRHGTGGTCWPLNGALWALVGALGYPVRGHAGTILTEELKRQAVTYANHGSVIVTLEGIDYLVDANIGSFAVMPLVAGSAASTGDGIHDIEAVPRGDSFDVVFLAGSNRDEPLTFQMRPEHDPVGPSFFRERYDESRDNDISPFNAALYVTRRFPDSIVTIGCMNKLVVDSEGVLTSIEVTEEERRQALIEELHFSEEIVAAIPPDLDEPNPFF